MQPLRHQHDAAAVPRQKLHSFHALAAEHEDVAAIRVRTQCFAHQRRQRVHRLAKVDRLCRQHHLEVEQPAGSAIAPRCLGDVRPLLKALRHDPGLLLARPSSSPALPGDHFERRWHFRHEAARSYGRRVSPAIEIARGDPLLFKSDGDGCRSERVGDSPYRRRMPARSRKSWNAVVTW